MTHVYEMARATPEPTVLPRKESDSESTLPIILGCVFGVLVLVIVIAIIVYKQKVAKKTKVSHQHIRSPSTQPLDTTCAENPAYHGSTEFNMNSMGAERPSTGTVHEAIDSLKDNGNKKIIVLNERTCLTVY